MKQTGDKIIKEIISRLKGVLEIEDAKRIYEISSIRVADNEDVVISGNPNVALDKLIRNLIKEGDYLAKITLHNIAKENGLNICPLCKETEKKRETEEKSESECDDDKDKDLTSKILHSDQLKKIVLIRLKNGATLSDHAADCPITVLCISGSGTFVYNGKSIKIEKGAVVELDAMVVHSVQAEKEIEILITKFQSGQNIYL